jgi:hypothetical protein
VGQGGKEEDGKAVKPDMEWKHELDHLVSSANPFHLYSGASHGHRSLTAGVAAVSEPHITAIL